MLSSILEQFQLYSLLFVFNKRIELKPSYSNVIDEMGESCQQKNKIFIIPMLYTQPYSTEILEKQHVSDMCKLRQSVMGVAALLAQFPLYPLVAYWI